MLVAGCSRVEVVQANQPPQSFEPQATSDVSAISATSDDQVLTMADVRAAFDSLDEPAAATVRLTERREADNQVLISEETVISDPDSGIARIEVDHSALSQVLVDGINEPATPEDINPILRIELMTISTGLIPREYVTQDGVAWSTFDQQRQATINSWRLLALLNDSDQLGPAIETLELTTAPLDKWISLKLIDSNPFQFPGHGPTLTPAYVREIVTDEWLPSGVQISDLRLTTQHLEGDTTFLEISDNQTTLLVEFDSAMRIQAIEQDLAGQELLHEVQWRRIEIAWEVEQSKLQLPSEEDRFDAIDMFATMGLGPECVPEGITTVAEMEAATPLTDLITQACIDQSPIMQMRLSASEKFEELDTVSSGD